MRGRLFALLPQSRLFARFYSELNVSMQCAHNPRVVTTLGGDVTISACGTLAKCFMVMERVPFTLGNFLRKEGSKMTVIKSLEIVTELLDIAVFLKQTEICHSDIKVRTQIVSRELILRFNMLLLPQPDNIMCRADGTFLRLTDFGQACAWGSRKGQDVVQDGYHKRAQFNKTYFHCSAKNNTDQADASVDQYSLALVMIQVLLGSQHKIYLYAIRSKKV